MICIVSVIAFNARNKCPEYVDKRTDYFSIVVPQPVKFLHFLTLKLLDVWRSTRGTCTLHGVS